MVPIYEQIVDQIKMLIRNGELKENDNLPSVRTLSKELKIRHLCSGYKYRTAFGRTEKRIGSGFGAGYPKRQTMWY